MPMTGQQPGVGGKMTGADKGACETVSGTPYVGADQLVDACPATPARPRAADFRSPWVTCLGGGSVSSHRRTPPTDNARPRP